MFLKMFFIKVEQKLLILRANFFFLERTWDFSKKIKKLNEN